MAKFKFQVAHFSPGRFFLFLLSMCDRRNSYIMKNNRMGKFYDKSIEQLSKEANRPAVTGACENLRCCFPLPPPESADSNN